jgi:hypothetical protein
MVNLTTTAAVHPSFQRVLRALIFGTKNAMSLE